MKSLSREILKSGFLCVIILRMGRPKAAVQRLCSIDGCERPHWVHGWCALHHDRAKRLGDPLAPVRQKISDVCIVKACYQPVYLGIKGLCRSHANNFYRYGNPTASRPMKTADLSKQCSVQDCCLIVYSKKFNLCSAHYDRFSLYGDPLASSLKFSEKAKTLPMCSIEGCDAVSRRSTDLLCSKHAARLKRNGDPSIESLSPRHYTDTKPGYIYLIKSDEFKRFKVGISNKPSQRLYTWEGFGWEAIQILGPMSGKMARDCESEILAFLKSAGASMGKVGDIGIAKGATETWTMDSYPVESLDELMNKIERLDKSTSMVYYFAYDN